METKDYKRFISKDNKRCIDLYVQYSRGEYNAFVMPCEYRNGFKSYSLYSGESMVIEEAKRFSQKRLDYLTSGKDGDVNKYFTRVLERVCKKNNININDYVETELTWHKVFITNKKNKRKK